MTAHYLSYFVEQGQATLIQLSDPMVSGDNLLGTANWSVNYWLSFHPSFLAVAKVLAVVTGHIAGVIAAHDRAIELLPTRHQVTGQLGMLVVMVVLHRDRALPAVRGLARARGDDHASSPRPSPAPARRRPRRGRGAAPSRRAPGAPARRPAPGRGGAVLGQEVHARRPGEALDHAPDVALGPAQAVAHPVDHDPQHPRGTGLPQLDQPARQTGQAHRVGGADHQHLVGGPRARRASSGCARHRACRSRSRIVLEAEAGVDDDVALPRRPAPGLRSTPSRTSASGRRGAARSAPRAARPTVRLVAANRRRSSSPALASRAAASRPETSSSTPRCCATEPPQGSSVDEHHRRLSPGQLGGEDTATVVRPGAPAGPQTTTTRPASPCSPGSGTGRSRVGIGIGHQVLGGRPVARRRRGRRRRPPAAPRPRRSGPARARPRRRPRACGRRAAADGSRLPRRGRAAPRRPRRRRPGRSRRTASRSARSTQRLSTTRPAPVSAWSAPDSHGAPAAATSTAVRSPVATAQPCRVITTRPADVRPAPDPARPACRGSPPR